MNDNFYSEFKIGERVNYKTRNGTYRGTIYGIGIEANAMVYDVKLDNGTLHWGYENQFTLLSEVFA